MALLASNNPADAEGAGIPPGPKAPVRGVSKEARSMVTLAADFWPLFWTIVVAGAVLTAAVSVLIALAGPSWTGHGRLSPPTPGHPEQLPPGQDHGHGADRRPAAV
jgi:hypothetical protein